MATEPQPTGPDTGELAPDSEPLVRPTVPQQASPPPTAPAQAAPAQAAPAQAAPAQAAPAQAAPVLPQHKVKRTRISGLWVSVGFFAVVLLLLLIFILQNGAKVDISYMGAHGHVPLGVALLLSAVCGVLLVVLAGTARISQLRAVARRDRRADAKRAKAARAAEGPASPAR